METKIENLRNSSVHVELHKLGSLRQQQTLVQAYHTDKAAATQAIEAMKNLATQQQMDAWSVVVKEAKSRVYLNLMVTQKQNNNSGRGHNN